MSLPRRRRLVEVARERELLVLEDNPYGLLRYEGEPLPTLYSLDAEAGRAGRRLGPGHLPGHVLEDPLARGCASAGRSRRGRCSRSSISANRAPTCAPRRSPSCSSPPTSPSADAHRPRPAWLEYVERLQRPLPAPARRDARGAGGALRRAGDAGRSPQGGLFIWATLDGGVDTTDLLARAAKGVAFVPGRAAYMDGRSGALLDAPELRRRARRGHPRGHPADRQGRWAADTGLLGALTGSPPRPPAAPRSRRAGSPDADEPPADRARTLADVVELPRRERRAARRAGDGIDERPRARSRCSRAGARWSARCRCARARGCRRRCARLGHEVVAIDAGPELVAQLHEAEPDAAFIALHGGDGEDGTVQGLLEAIGMPYTGSGPAACMRCTDKALAKYLMREAGIPTPDFPRSRRARSRSSASAAALADIERRLGFPLVVKPASQGSALGVKFARCSDGAARRDRRGALLRPQGRDRALRQGPRPGGVGARCDRPPTGERRGAAGGRGDPARGGVLRLRVALRDRHDDVRLPGRAAGGDDRARPGAGAARCTGCSAATASRAST